MVAGDKHRAGGPVNTDFDTVCLVASSFFFFLLLTETGSWAGVYSECNWIAAWTSALSLMLKVQTAHFLLSHWKFVISRAAALKPGC